MKTTIVVNSSIPRRGDETFSAYMERVGRIMARSARREERRLKNEVRERIQATLARRFLNTAEAFASL